MVDIVMIILGCIVFCLAGLTLLIIVDREDVLGKKMVLRLSLSFILGMGLVSLEMFFYSLLSIDFGFTIIALPWVLLFSFLTYYDFNGAGKYFTFNKASLKSFTFLEKIMFAFLLFEFIYLCRFSLFANVLAWDAQHIWFLKAKAFFVDGGITKEFLLDRIYFDSHADYPLMVPLSMAWLYTALGSVDDRIVKLIYPLQYMSLLVIFFYTVKSFISRHYALIFTVLLSLVPVLQAHSGGFPGKVGHLYAGDFVGYADLTLSVYFLAASGCMYMYMKRNDNTFFFLSLIFFAMSGWIKNEGLVFMASGFLITCLYTYMYDRVRFKYFLMSLSFPLVFILPWMIYRGVIGVDDESVFKLRGFGFREMFFRFLTIFYNFGKLFLNLNLFTTVWYIFFVFLLLNLRDNLKKPLIFMNLLLFMQLGAYVMAYFFTTKDLGLHVSTSLDRVLLHLTPLALLITAISSYEFFHKSEKTPSTE